jgi:hypothetical protein
MKNDFIRKTVPPLFWQVLSLGISAALFSLILLNRSPNLLRPVSMALRSGFGLAIPLAALVVYLAFRVPRRLGEFVGMAVVLSLFAMPLAGLWASGQSQSTVLSGLIPLFDAESYYTDALRLMNGEDFSIFSARRPLFASLLAVILTLTGRNLMAALAVLTFLTGLACYVTAREIQRAHGAEFAVFVLTIIFLFYRAHSGVSMSENLGVMLGTLGFGLLWRGASARSLFYIWLGLLASTLALNARAGAFFTLPLLVLWAGRLLKEEKWISWRAFFISVSAVVLGFALNLILTRLVAAPSGVPFANFSYTLYGLASGGKSWVYVFETHPELSQIPEPEQSKLIYRMAFDLIRQNPLQTLRGALFNWKMLFSDTWYNVYAYVGGENWKVNLAARWSIYLLCLFGIFASMRNRADPVYSLVLAAALGVFLSVPFLPPTDAYRMRPYAASVVVFAALPAFGFDFLLNQLKRIPLADKVLDKPSLRASSSMLAFMAILLPVLLAAPVLIQSAAKPQRVPAVSCPEGLTPIFVRFDEGTYIHLKRQSEPFLDWAPNFHIGTFRASAHSLADGAMIAWAESLDAPATIFVALDLLSGNRVMAVIPPGLIPETGSPAKFCGEWGNDPRLRGYGIFYGIE